MSTACLNESTSNEPSSRRNFMRFSDARLQALSSTCMYSEHGFDALMRPLLGQVCHWLITVSYWTPGSAQRHAASAISRISWRASSGSPTGSPVARAVVCHSPPLSTACMNSSVTRTELLAFWYWIEVKPSPSIDMSNPASRSAAALSSSLALHQMNSRMSGWSTSSTTILAARRVLPPDLIVPAHESAPRMKETGPEAVPPLPSGSMSPRMLERLMPEPEPPRKILPSLVFQSRIESIVSSTLRMKQAEHCGCSSKPTLNQTGLLNAASWWRRMWVSSASKASPSSGVAKYPRARPQSAIVPDTRPIICLTERSRAGVSSCPRKYFWATMFVAFCDQDFGNSTFSCSNTMRSPWPMRASRVSHSTLSKGWTPGVVKYRLIDSARPGWTSSVRAVCAVNSMKALSSPWPQFAGFLRSIERVLRVTADHPLRVGRNPFSEAPVVPQLYGGAPTGQRENRRAVRLQRPSR